MLTKQKITRIIQNKKLRRKLKKKFFNDGPDNQGYKELLSNIQQYYTVNEQNFRGNQKSGQTEYAQNKTKTS